MFHCDHGENSQNKKDRAEAEDKKTSAYIISNMMYGSWDKIEKELKEEIEAIRCAMCHDQHTGE